MIFRFPPSPSICLRAPLPLCAACLLALVCLPFGAGAQMTPDAPLKNFRLPMFGENGFKEWELRGVEGNYISPEQSEIIGLDLIVFSGDERSLEETRIRSPRARVFMKASRAEGDTSLFVSGLNFSLAGEDWTWDGNAHLITVRQNARVTFDEAIDILK